MKILFIADMNLGRDPQGGGQFKSRMLRKVYQEIPNLVYQEIDTTGYKKDMSILFKLLGNLFFRHFDKIIVSTSTKSADLLFQILYVFRSRLLGKIIFNPQGMYIQTALLTGIYSINKYKRLEKLYFESNRGVELFKEKGIPAMYYSNAKYFDLNTRYIELKNTDDKQLKLVFISRICEDKGLNVLFNALNKIKDEFVDVHVTVDFYGPIQSDFEVEFNENLSENYKYCGYLDMLTDAGNSYVKLSQYDALVLPTFWKGEGIAGVFIDAFIAGLPILTTSWGVNEEIVTDGVNGWIVPPKDVSALSNKIVEIASDITKLNQMKICAFDTRIKYHISQITETLTKDVQV